MNGCAAAALLATAALLGAAACGDQPKPAPIVSYDDLTPASPEVTAEIMQAHQEYVAAIRAQDSDALRAMFTENYQCLRTNGRIVDLDETMRLLELSYVAIDEISFEDESVFMLGDHAYGFSRFRQSGAVGEQTYDLSSRSLDVFVRRGDRWLVAFTAVTPITGEAGETITDAAKDER